MSEMTFWACDPELNENCPKKFKSEFCIKGGKCKLCDGTFDVRFARRNKKGEPISNKEWHQMKRK